MPQSFPLPLLAIDGPSGAVAVWGGFMPGRHKTLVMANDGGWSGQIALEISGDGTRFGTWTILRPGGVSARKQLPIAMFLYIRTNRTGSLSTDTLPTLDLVIEQESGGLADKALPPYDPLSPSPFP